MELILKDKVAIITGAARGIGQATVKLLAQEGAKIIACDRDQIQCQETVSAITDYKEKVIPCVGDVTEEGFPERIIKKTVKYFGPDIDILVNNAGYGGAEFIHKATDSFWQRMLEVNLTAPFKIIRAACPFMRDSAKIEIEEGRKPKCRKIINVSSVAGTNGFNAGVSYGSSKAGLIGLTKTLSKEFGCYNICVNAVAFGLIDTRLSRSAENGGTWKIGTDTYGLPGMFRNEIIKNTPLGRMGTADEAAGAILFLASSLSDYITGQVIKVSGGY